MRHRLILPTLAALLSLGCVTKNVHELVEVQLDATRTALSARQAACFSQAQELEGQIVGLSATLIERDAALSALGRRILHLEEELNSLQGRHAEILTLQEAPPDPEADPEAEPTQLIAATAAEMTEALALREAARYADTQHTQRAEEVRSALDPILVSERGSLHEEDGQFLLRIPVHMLFDENTVRVSPRGEVIVDELAGALRALPDYALEIGGHTDDRPLHTAAYPSNWELGFAQAVGLLRTLEGRGIPMSPSATSFAGTRPVADNETPEGRKRNRRLDLVLTPSPDPEVPAADPPTSQRE